MTVLILALALSACGSGRKPIGELVPTRAVASTTPDSTTIPAAASGLAAIPIDTTATAPPTSATRASSTTATGTPATPVPSGAVADVGGTPISLAAYHHWLIVAVNGSSNPGKVPIVPDYPKFTHCISEAHSDKKLATLSRATLLSDCRELFTSLNRQVLDFLVKSVWYEKAGAAAHELPTAAQVQAAFMHEKSAQFHTRAAYQAFLGKAGETQADILFRVRTNLIVAKLAQTHKGQAALDTALSTQYRPLTACAADYTMSDCAGAPASSAP